MTFYHPFPFLGMVVWEHGTAEIFVHVTGNGWKRYDCWWLRMIVEQWFRNLYTIGASSLQYFYTTSTVPTSLRQRSRPHASRWQLLIWRCLTVARHSRTRARDVSRSSFCHGAMSPSFVVGWTPPRLASSFHRPGRARTATCTFWVLAAHEPSTSAVLLRGAPRHVSPSTERHLHRTV